MKYRTIVADPPWAYDATGVNFRESDYRRKTRYLPGKSVRTALPYPSMTVAEIAALPIRDLAENHAHLYLWTTQKYLRDSFDVADAWGFTLSTVLVWCKPIRGWVPGGTFMSTTEFILFCRRGSLKAKQRVERQWFEWSRGQHSAKPEAFLDMVEATSPGPYLEMFARRQRLGWDTWGNEALEHVQVGT